MKLHTLLQVLQPYQTYNGDSIEISSIENDHRKVTQGSLFVCIKGFTVDGHDLAAEAVKAGAVAVIAERELLLEVPVITVKNTKRAMSVLADAFYGHPTHKLQLIGITGTNGKTTTSHLIEKMAQDFGKTTGLIGTMYTKVGDDVFTTKNTTPESLTLQRTFKQMVDAEVSTAVMEVSSHALDEGRVHGCDFDIAVFTNLTQDHLDYHGTMEEYKRAKGLLFAQLGSRFQPDAPKYAILNADDAATEQYIRSTSAHILTYGIDQAADFKAHSITIQASGTSFTLDSPLGVFNVNMKLIGKFSVYNVLAAISTGVAAGIPIDRILASIEEVEGVSGRFETVDAGQDFSVIVDYSHTPDSLENALQTIQEFADKRIFTVVGCGGDRDRTKRPIMAQISCAYSSNPIFTSDNPRSEDPNSILADMEAGATGNNYKIISDRREAIRYAISQASAGDVILIAGKGHETYQQIGDQIFDFDDRIEAKKAIEER
ncbi:UDP-N-acetylmuramoyl-L-alanyl-D-glutamate--2,6-diaminopimelate ligase [Cytobacillus gottheilii]|uniref:UDP-N-acetylmuramoyl-L-alanyl-D-glutamate--2, 6-diaminopimelate ligase n=1 Tax=Cytobacillus gottheilii TaxID=859144 RepID=UPI0009BC210F|nr:UDP-N-acetylmuramoyl-L-alanyl-D-glutamate--2,6-diaminopimelate ligase [Cytobacillus gottheilii]